MATHSSTLAWKIPWTEEPGRLQSMRLQRVGHNWATSVSMSSILMSYTGAIISSSTTAYASSPASHLRSNWCFKKMQIWSCYSFLKIPSIASCPSQEKNSNAFAWSEPYTSCQHSFHYSHIKSPAVSHTCHDFSHFLAWLSSPPCKLETVQKQSFKCIFKNLTWAFIFLGLLPSLCTETQQ